jgi:hypothetical protein
MRRVIDRVDLVYRKETGGGHAFMTVYGRRSELSAIEGSADQGATTPQPDNDPA